MFLAGTGEVYEQPDNNCIHTYDNPAKLKKLPFKDIIDIGVYGIQTYSRCGLSRVFKKRVERFSLGYFIYV